MRQINSCCFQLFKVINKTPVLGFGCSLNLGLISEHTHSLITRPPLTITTYSLH